MSENLARRDPWQSLRQLTAARIALGRCGGSLPTCELLDFQAAHAAARDAVHEAFDVPRLIDDLRPLGRSTLTVSSQVNDRATYLRRPDLGRILSEPSRRALQQVPGEHDLCIVISDGLSATATHRQVPTLLQALDAGLRADWRVAPIVIAPFARVAIQDDIGTALRANVALILLGERPGLGSPDSLGAYLIHRPRAGATDADRNCVSNIRPEGLPPATAAEHLLFLLRESRRRQLSGIRLKDDRPISLPLP